jgi:hypothetical protein
LPGRKLCERHSSHNPSRFRPKPPPSLDSAALLLASDRKARRKTGMEMLCALKATDRILAHALTETDSLILGMASYALEYHPPELIHHLLTQPSAFDARLYLRFHLARNNSLYAEETIRAIFSKRRTLTLEAIQSIGLAYLQSLSDLLHRYLSAPLELYEEARRLKGDKAVAGVEGYDKSGWSRNGWSAIRAATALTRLDAEFDLVEVSRLLQEAERIESDLPRGDLWAKERVAHSVRQTRACLEWILFDKGIRLNPEPVLRLAREPGMTRILPDLATTLLKHGEERLLKQIAREFAIRDLIADCFCYWPLMNWLECNGFLPKNYAVSDTGDDGTLYPFWRARAQGIAPPRWWRWR